MNVEIRTEAGQFPEKEYINGIFLAVKYTNIGDGMFLRHLSCACIGAGYIYTARVHRALN